jgi:carboxypeptidase family protein
MTTPPQSASSPQPVSLDERKFERESADKQREFDLREREVAAKEKELRQSRWSNPLVIGLFAAALGLAGNIWVEHANNKWAKDAERSKAQSTLILDAIKTGDADKACKNLLFFVRLGLITEGGQTVKSECATAPQGPPSLPSSSSLPPYRFERSPITVTDHITGTVKDVDNQSPIEGCLVVSSIGVTSTNKNGDFQLPLPKGPVTITITITKPGYTAEKKNIIVDANLAGMDIEDIYLHKNK